MEPDSAVSVKHMIRVLPTIITAIILTGCANPPKPVATSETRRQFVLDNIESATATFTYHASASDPRKVHNFSVALYVPRSLRAPMVHRADGTPAGSDRQVSAATMRGIVESLASDGFFVRAKRRHSTMTMGPRPAPPADSVELTAADVVEPGAEGGLTVQIIISDGAWHHYFQATYRLDHKTRDVVQRLADRAPDEVRGDLESGLLGKMR